MKTKASAAKPNTGARFSSVLDLVKATAGDAQVQSFEKYLGATDERLLIAIGKQPSLVERIKESAMRAMQAHGVKTLETTTNKLTVCGNGGLQRVADVLEAGLSPQTIPRCPIASPL